MSATASTDDLAISAWQNGKHAYAIGAWVQACPYRNGHPLAVAWCKGWHDARAEESESLAAWADQEREKQRAAKLADLERNAPGFLSGERPPVRGCVVTDPAKFAAALAASQPDRPPHPYRAALWIAAILLGVLATALGVAFWH